MQKTKIPWADYTVNPVKGLCPMACPYCYARRMYKRFKWDEAIRFEPQSSFVNVFNAPAGSRIFVGSTFELFGDWVKPEWIKQILGWADVCPDKTFIFLTKQPQNLQKWRFPDNCWVGVSITSAMDCIIRLPKMVKVSAKVKFVSFEPLLKPISSSNQLYIRLKLSKIGWIIIGQQTPVKKETTPTREWVYEIIEAADTSSIPVFVKEPLASYMNIKRQELPRSVSVGEGLRCRLTRVVPIKAALK